MMIMCCYTLRMAGRLLVRNIPDDVLAGLEILASQCGRSLEGEARMALELRTEPLLIKREQSKRRQELAARLNELLKRINVTKSSRFLWPSHVAEAIGETHVEQVERWFTGEVEPSLSQLESIADYLGGTRNWLKHGDGTPFSVDYKRLPRNPTEAVQWLLQARNGGQKLTHLHLVRAASTEGQLVIIKQYDDWRCETYTTPNHISEENGGTGQGDLASFVVTLCLLYKADLKAGCTVSSYVIGWENYMNLINGKVHPLQLFTPQSKSLWWEDLWDESLFKKHARDVYWPGWQSLCEYSSLLIEESPYLRDERKAILSGEHN